MALKPASSSTIKPHKRMAMGTLPSGADAVQSYTAKHGGKPITSK